MATGLDSFPKIYPVSGFKLGTASAGIKEISRKDLVVMQIAENSAVAALFTKNAFCAAPIEVARNSLAQHVPRYLVVNTGNANAGTGARGIRDAQMTCAKIAELTEVDSDKVLPFSTGVIGEYLPTQLILDALPSAIEALHEDGWEAAARSILTTDTRPKASSKRFAIPSYHAGTSEVTISPEAYITLTGIAKGSGMIKPNMATMLSFIATDASIDDELLHRALTLAANKSFNRITVDGDTSTNDALVLVATGHSGVVVDELNFSQFQANLESVCVELAQACIRDGEGAAKFVTIVVANALNLDEALEVAYTVAESPLVKTALGASDANWGRILAAIGRAEISHLDMEKVDIYINGTLVVHQGQRSADYSEEAGSIAMQTEDIEIKILLDRGDVSQTIWTTDLGHEYVRINADYRT